VREELTQRLVCPVCHLDLRWEVSRRAGDDLQEATGSCRECRVDYPVHRGVGAFLTPDRRPQDLWEEADQGLRAFLNEEPARARRLLESPVESLNPTDQLVRGLLQQERQEFGEARRTLERAQTGLYTSAYRSALDHQLRFVREELRGCAGPVVDLATGMGSLLEFVVPSLAVPCVGTDLSPRVLLRDQRALEQAGLGARVSLLAFDARRTPFKDGSVPTLITNLGLANIEDPAGLLQELRRIVSGRFLAITIFYPETEGPNEELIRRLKLEPMLHRESALRRFRESGFEVRVCNLERALARPTPRGEIMSEMQPDRLPVVDEVLEVCTLVAS